MMVRAERGRNTAIILTAASIFTFAERCQSAAPDFRFEVRPILSKNCFSCHGPDEAHRQADLRLDERTAAIETGAIVPGNAEESEVVRRMTSQDPEERMPPVKSGRKLTGAEIVAIRAWI